MSTGELDSWIRQATQATQPCAHALAAVLLPLCFFGCDGASDSDLSGTGDASPALDSAGTGADRDGSVPTPQVDGGGSAGGGLAAGHYAPVSSVSAAVIPGATGAYPDIALDSAGNIHLVYAREASLYYRRWTPASGWSQEQDTGVAQSPSYRNEPDVAVDSNDRAHVVGGTAAASGYAFQTAGGIWMEISPGTSRDSELAMDRDDNVYIIDRNGSGGGYLGMRILLAGAGAFSDLPAPDIANGLPLGRNDHVYGDLFIGPGSQLHIAYRHGSAPGSVGDSTVYRGSFDGGQSYAGSRITGQDSEAPHIVADGGGTIFVADGGGTVHRSDDGGTTWTTEQRAVTALGRWQPELSVSGNNTLYVSCWDGRYNVRTPDGTWLGEMTVSSVTGNPIGFMETAAGSNGAYAVWEEGSNVLAENDGAADDFVLVFASLSQTGQIGGP